LRCYRTIGVVNTPFNNPKSDWEKLKRNTTKVKIVDPTHPLFNQSFNVLEWRNSPGNLGYVFVEYKHLTRLYIPIDATDLGFIPPTSVTKLTYESIQALINLGMEVDLCHKPQSMSLKNYQTSNKKRS
jgi:hypothetical protein